MVGLHGPPWLTVQDAIVLGQALEPSQLLFIEDPTAPENLQSYRRIRDALVPPLAAGERTATAWGWRPIGGRELVDGVQPDTGDRKRRVEGTRVEVRVGKGGGGDTKQKN